MKLEYALAVAAPPDRLWSRVMDIPQAARCLPGAAAVTPMGSGEFKGTLLAQVGPLRLVLEGEIAVVTRDDVARRALLRASAKDTRLGGTLRARVDVEVNEAPGGSRLRISTDAEVGGRIGEFGQAVMERKSAKILEQFMQCVAAAATR